MDNKKHLIVEVAKLVGKGNDIDKLKQWKKFVLSTGVVSNMVLKNYYQDCNQILSKSSDTELMTMWAELSEVHNSIIKDPTSLVTLNRYLELVDRYTKVN